MNGIKFVGPKGPDGRPLAFVAGLPTDDISADELKAYPKDQVKEALAARYLGKPLYEEVAEKKAAAKKAPPKPEAKPTPAAEAKQTDPEPDPPADPPAGDAPKAD